MNYYIIVTDVNSRQYVFQIPDDGILIKSLDDNFIVTKENPQLESFLALISQGNNFIIDNKSMFISKNLIDIEYRIIAEGTY